MVILLYHRLWFPVYSQGRFSQFSFAETIIQSAYISGFFLVTLVNSHTSLPCLILPYIPPYVKSVAEQNFMLLHVLSFVNIRHVHIMRSISSPYCWHTLHSLLLFFNIFVSYYSVCSAWSCAAIIRLAVYAISPRRPQECTRILFTNKLSAYLYF
jgi:hypothetical protein